MEHDINETCKTTLAHGLLTNTKTESLNLNRKKTMLYHAMNNTDGSFETVDSEEENTPTTGTDNPFSVENTAEVVREFNAIDAIKSGTFNKLVAIALHILQEGDGIAQSALRAEALAAHLDEAEEIAITDSVDNPERYANGVKVGKIKTALYLSKTYKHARSTLVNFLEQGGDLLNSDGSVKGKTAIEKEKKIKREGLSPEEKLLALVPTIIALSKQTAYPNAAMDNFINQLRG